MNDERPSCLACGESGVYGVCEECRQPAHEAEEWNHNVRTQSHNLFNFHEW